MMGKGDNLGGKLPNPFLKNKAKPAEYSSGGVGVPKAAVVPQTVAVPVVTDAYGYGTRPSLQPHFPRGVANAPAAPVTPPGYPYGAPPVGYPRYYDGYYQTSQRVPVSVDYG
jgi:hypothetical protein